MFTISYSDLGGRTVRKIVASHGNPDGATDLYTICMHPNTKPSSFVSGTVAYNVHGLPNGNGTVDFDACMKLIQEKTLGLLTPKPSPLKNESEIYVFSAFFSVFKETGLIDPIEGGQAILSRILSSAKKACRVEDNKNPFLCHDLIYMYVLLHDGFELKPEIKVNFLQKLKGHNVSWTLGFAYDLLAGLKREKKFNRKEN
ncbi:ectonucleoside triphosphate diphosphohydrolase 5-like [Contarinia nasturtii]|uniref:ectonucleoside triphosphate diphosphohydrolase 5-like n=1 Tax=Contarinia nasturtii TaxID=265458 RepID=UPI0012D37C17|nr:ectonucleoside triphosphate diphosphohydrolase 5-like [Contarinia nasturtii]